MPQDWNYGTDRLGDASMALGSGWRGFERYRLLSTVIVSHLSGGAKGKLPDGSIPRPARTWRY